MAAAITIEIRSNSELRMLCNGKALEGRPRQITLRAVAILLLLTKRRAIRHPSESIVTITYDHFPKGYEVLFSKAFNFFDNTLSNISRSAPATKEHAASQIRALNAFGISKETVENIKINVRNLRPHRIRFRVVAQKSATDVANSALSRLLNRLCRQARKERTKPVRPPGSTRPRNFKPTVGIVHHYDGNSGAASANIVDTLMGFYGMQEHSASLKQYVFTCNGELRRTTIYARQRWLQLGQDVRKMNASLVVPPTFPTQSELRSAVRKFEQSDLPQLQDQIELYNDPLFRLVDFNDKSGMCEFCETDFFTYRATVGMLPDELTAALDDTNGNVKAVLADKDKYLPFRAKFLPTIESLNDYQNRLCVGGIGALLAIARDESEHDFLIPLQIRGSRVSDGRGQLAVLPKAFHQPLVGDKKEVRLYYTLLREIYEEVYGHDEVKTGGGKIKCDWYVKREPGVRFIHENPKSCQIEATCIGINALAGNYDVGMLVAIRDPEYWERFGEHIDVNWESEERMILISSKDSRRIADILVSGEWAQESIPPFVEGLRALHRMDKARVTLPDIRRVGE